ncbi:T9SS response regulator signal transducer PorX, partial [Flavobacterium psychrophilum]
PVQSHDLFKKLVIPELKKEENVLFVVIDNLRYDQWKAFENVVNNHYKLESEVPYFAILPTATQYARNAIFSGLLPSEMEKQFPQYWKNDTEDGGKNLYEAEFLTAQLKRNGLNIEQEYFKITNLNNGKKLAENFKSLKDKKLVTVVYNFIDMLSHAKTDMDVVKELASDDKAYRSLTLSWFKNSPLLEIIQQAQKLGFKLIITTDHGTINCKNPSKVIGDKNTSLNLRYKTGRSLTYENKEVYAVKDPKKIGLPSINMTSIYIFAKNDIFLAYVNNYNHYVSYYRNTYQHGGISLEEVIVPFLVFSPKK